MAVAVSYPGVYIKEVPSGARAIAGVPTSVAAFVGYSLRGPIDEAVQIFSLADFERTFGELHPSSALSYAVNHFFLNGGATAWIVRVAEDAAAASVTLNAGATPTLRVDASSEGAWGNGLQLIVDYDTSSPGSTFNLTINEVREQAGRLLIARSEIHRNLSMNDQSANWALATVNAESRLVELADLAAPGGNAVVTSGEVSDAIASGLTDAQRRIGVTINGTPLDDFDLFALGGNLADLEAARMAIENNVRGLMGDPLEFSVAIVGNRLVADLATAGRNASIRFRNAATNSGTAALRLTAASGAREEEGAALARPTPSGTAAIRLPAFEGTEVTGGDTLMVEVRDAAGTLLNDATTVAFAIAPATLGEARRELERQMRSGEHPALAGATVGLWDSRLVVRAGPDTPSMQISLTGDAAVSLGFTDPAVTQNLSAYQVGVGPVGAAQSAVVPGLDGMQPSGTNLVDLYRGDRGDKTGLYALEDADLFNILNIPDISDIDVLTEAVVYAEERRSMILIDLDENVSTVEDARGWVNDAANSGLKHRNSAIYFPRLLMSDPVQGGRIRPFPNSGVIAGLWARTDAERGVSKAPAGIDARLRGVRALDYLMTDPENGVLNPFGVNCLRTFPVYGTVSWGGRTLVGADAFASEWKYIPVRRMALYIEESLYRGTQFVVFEPNDEPLWAQIRLTVGSFMQQLFRQGALQGKTPQEAYLVRCDSSTTTQADIDLGIVNIHVGFAPLKPAEFVVILIQQLAGQSQA